MKKTSFVRIVSVLVQALFLVGCATTKPAASYQSFSGSVTAIEKYGHAVTDVKADDLFSAGYEMGDVLSVTYDNGYTFKAPLVSGYDVDKGQTCVRTKYADGNIAFCINYGKMNVVANIAVGTKFTLSMAEKGAYRMQYEIRNLERTDDRKDYASDEVFANYRAVVPGVLYRGCHPSKTDWARATYVSALMEKDGIKTIIDMSDNEEDLKKYLDASNPYASSLVKKLYGSGNVCLLSMSMTFTDEAFGKNIAEAVRFILSHEGPAFVHCNEGKDRTGFFAVFSEALIGWDEKKIEDDYMLSYLNFYHMEKGSEKYKVIASANFVPMLSFIKGNAKDLKEGAKAYAASIGLSEKEIADYAALLRK